LEKTPGRNDADPGSRGLVWLREFISRVRHCWEWSWRRGWPVPVRRNDRAGRSGGAGA